MSLAALTDREIDALVVERIMEWTIRGHYYCDGGEPIWAVGAFRPSEEIAAAFAVVEMMREPGWEVVICASRVRWDVTFGRDQEDAQAYADTVTRAICLAALSAMNGGDA